MDHLYSSTVAVYRLVLSSEDGAVEYAWSPVSSLQRVPCRLDLNFLRPGKDLPSPVEAGRAPDRIGVMFCRSTVGLKPGDHIRAVKGPVVGTFAIKAMPDQALDYGSAHHIEVQIVEVAQNVAAYLPVTS